LTTVSGTVGGQLRQVLLYNINRKDFITALESVYSAVRTESLHKAATFRL
jgi:hypothetical protein